VPQYLQYIMHSIEFWNKQRYSQHILRHGCVTLLFTVRPKIVQELLGHSNFGITLDAYLHVLPGMATRRRARWKTP
jgi:integrase